MIYLLCIILLLIGVFGIISQRNLIKIIISISIVEYAVNLLLILIGYRSDGTAPIMTERGMDSLTFAQRSVDPLPQAMVLTSIVIGLGVMALMVTMALRIYHVYGTYDIREIFNSEAGNEK